MESIRRTIAGVKADLLRSEPRSSSAERLEANVRINIYHGIVSTMALNLAQPFVGIFAVKMGATDFQVGLLSSGPALVSLLSMIPGGKFIDSQRHKKRAISTLILLQRLFYFFISLIPFFTQDRRAWLLVFAVALMNIPASIANIGWQSFISELVPPSRRADAFAARNKLMNLSGTVIVLITGRLIDIAGFPMGYQLTFAGAFLMTLLEIWTFNRLDDSSDDETVVRTAKPAMSLLRDLKEMSKHDRFVRYTMASIVFYLCWQAPWPLFTLYQVKVLGANNMWVSLLSLANTGGSLVGYGFWVRQLNKRGTMPTLFMSSLGIFIVPLAYAFSKNLPTVTFFNLLTGAVFSGVNLALFNALLEVTPSENRTTYIAYYTTAVNAAAIFAPMVGVALLNMMGFFWAFIATAALRLAGSFTFLIVSYLDKRSDRLHSGGDPSPAPEPQ
jgi:MFS family permease